MFKKIIIAIVLVLIAVSGSQAAISSASVTTGLLNSERLLISTNTSINITFTESAVTNYTNISFPADFSEASLVAANITNNTVGTSIIISGTWVNITYTAQAAGILTFNFTANVKSTATAGDYFINISTNATASQSGISLYVRDPAKPFFVKSNNSVFTAGTETFGTLTTTIPLTGKGVANITFYAPNITGQTNITVGYGATNSTLVRAAYTSGTTPNNTIYVETDGTITNPVVTLSAVQELQSNNLPAALIAAGAITTLIYVYRQRRRSR